MAISRIDQQAPERSGRMERRHRNALLAAGLFGEAEPYRPPAMCRASTTIVTLTSPGALKG